MKFEKTMRFYDSNRLGDTLFIFHKNHKKYLNDALLKHDLNLIQVLCILMIYECDTLNQKDLADGLYLTKGAITKAINKLEKNGIVIRKKSSKDKREYLLTLSEKGLELIPKIDQINKEWENRMGLKDLDKEFLDTLNSLALKSINLNIENQ